MAKQSNDHNLSRGGRSGQESKSAIPLHKKLALGEKVDGTRDPNRSRGGRHTGGSRQTPH